MPSNKEPAPKVLRRRRIKPPVTIAIRSKPDKSGFALGSDLDVWVNGRFHDGIEGIEIGPMRASGGLLQVTLQLAPGSVLFELPGVELTLEEVAQVTDKGE